uniref:histidine--tRNA ligase n=1 Tax=Paulinella chromatophora TaxID=39717 RepID=B1X3U7_PAUCH|nr:Histidine--tRNA ligase [Paulinella chromatophora]ACB42616.1 Histidine--tRNA ligase [Paulinella chromatophora]
MALQPAAGSRDLNPQQVEINHRLCEKLAAVYKLWGYQEVSPPRVERLATLLAGGAIEPEAVVQLVANEALALRPEMTASIARAACTRMAGKMRPLRLWSTGTTFQGRIGYSGGLRIEETLQNGVEILGVHDSKADMELLQLLLTSFSELPFRPEHRPQLLIGHHRIVSDILTHLPMEHRALARDALTGFDPLAIQNQGLNEDDAQWLEEVLRLRGEPREIISKLKERLGATDALLDMEALLEIIIPRAEETGILIQLDPSFEPPLNLYNGLVFQLVCMGPDAPIIVANGGRYDALLGEFGAPESEAAGIGFSFAIEDIRELLFPMGKNYKPTGSILIAYSKNVTIKEAFSYQRHLHIQGLTSELQLTPCESLQQAESIARARGAFSLEWLDS